MRVVWIAGVMLLSLTASAFAWDNSGQDDQDGFGAPRYSYGEQPNYSYQNPDDGMGRPGQSPTPWENGGRMHGSCIGYVCY